MNAVSVSGEAPESDEEEEGEETNPIPPLRGTLRGTCKEVQDGAEKISLITEIY